MGTTLRIAIVTSPRTSSTFLGSYISCALGLKNYGEILNNNLFVFDDNTHFMQDNMSLLSNDDIINRLTNTDDYVVKLISSVLVERNFTMQNFPWSIFDKIILLERNDIVKQIVSWYTLNCWESTYTNPDVNNKYEITDEFIKFAVGDIKLYHYVKDMLLQHHISNCVVVEKESAKSIIREVFNINNETQFIKNCSEDIAPQCSLTGIDYDVIITSQNVRNRVINILQQELLWKN